MEQQRASLVSPLDNAVMQIMDTPQYLTAEHGKRLMATLRRQFPNDNVEDEAADKDILRKQLKSMGTSLASLVAKAVGGETTDMKRVVDAQLQYFKVVAKYEDTLKANDRTQAIEAATIAALQELGDMKLYNRFLVLFRVKLEDKTENLP